MCLCFRFTGDNMSTDLRQNRLSKWYFGGVASSGAACFTHPLDLLKVTLQTQQKTKLSAIQITGKIIRERGILAFYNGLSASLLRQITYSTTRFGLYEVGKNEYGTNFAGKVMLAGASGAAGGNLHLLYYSLCLYHISNAYYFIYIFL